MGKTVKELSEELQINQSTISKGIIQGRIIRPTRQEDELQTLSTKGQTTRSSRSYLDGQSPLGMGCTNIEGRVDVIKKK